MAKRVYATMFDKGDDFGVILFQRLSECEKMRDKFIHGGIHAESRVTLLYNSVNEAVTDLKINLTDITKEE